MLKKVISILALIVISFSLIACGSAESKSVEVENVSRENTDSETVNSESKQNVARSPLIEGQIWLDGGGGNTIHMYMKEDGTLANNEWVVCDIDNDGLNEYVYFENIDSYLVDIDPDMSAIGPWTEGYEDIDFITDFDHVGIAYERYEPVEEEPFGGFFWQFSEITKGGYKVDEYARRIDDSGNIVRP